MNIRSGWHITGGFLTGFWGYDNIGIAGAATSLFIAYQVMQEYYICFEDPKHKPDSQKDIKEWTAALFIGYGVRWGLSIMGVVLWKN